MRRCGWIVRELVGRARLFGCGPRIRLIVGLVLAAQSPAWCAAQQPSRLVLIVAGNISIRDIATPNLRHLGKLLREGSCALMNVRTGRPTKLVEPAETAGMEAGCLTIGAGAMAAGGAEVRRAARVHTPAALLWGNVNRAGPSAAELYACQTGRRPGRAEVVHVEIVKMQRINSAAAYRAKPGLLGSGLRAAGIRTAVVGCSSIPGEPHGEAAAIAMDRAGLVDRGDVDSRRLTVGDPRCAFGIRSDPESLLREIDRAMRWCRFIVVDFGDTFRADRYGEYCGDELARCLRESAAARLDEFVGRICARLDFERDALILLSPSSRTWSEIEGERLTPIVIRGPDFGGGMLTSPSTRRVGLVTICDVAPTVLSFFGLKAPADMTGRPIRAVGRENAAATLLKLNLEASKQAQRQVTMRGSSVVQSVVVVVVTAALVLGGTRWRRTAAWAALVPVVIPLAMLYAPALCSAGLEGTIACLAVLAGALLGACGLILRRPARAFVWLCGAIVASVLVDLARGAPLISRSVAGYSPIEGARYYGLGNELMGTLLGATIMGTGAAAVEPMSRVGAVVFLVVFFFVGWPGLGADAGGAAASAPAMAVTLLAGQSRRTKLRATGTAVLAAIICVAALFAVDALRGGGSQSHIGRMAQALAEGGIVRAFQVLQRKVALNLTLVSASPWSRLLALSLIGSALLYRQGRHRFGPRFLSRGDSAAALGCCVGTAAAFAFNDSGVLAAAACAVFLWVRLALGCAVADDAAEGTKQPNTGGGRPTDPVRSRIDHTAA